MTISPTLHNPHHLLAQPIQRIHQLINLPIRRLNQRRNALGRAGRVGLGDFGGEARMASRIFLLEGNDKMYNLCKIS